jgi:hypothetical protein
MAKVKFDGVVEAVHYQPDGQVAWVRAYERRGATFSDHVLIDRQNLIQKLKNGKRFVVGRRLPYLASTFEVSAPLQVVQVDGKEVLATGGAGGGRDSLTGVPVI